MTITSEIKWNSLPHFNQNTSPYPMQVTTSERYAGEANSALEGANPQVLQTPENLCDRLGTRVSAFREHKH